MSRRELVRAALDAAERLSDEGEPLTPVDINVGDVTEIREALAIWRAAKRQREAARQVAKAVGEQVATLLGDGGAARVGDVIVRYRLGRRERCIDPAGVLDYVEAQVRSGELRLDSVMNPNQLRRSWMSDAARSTFYEWEDEQEPSLVEVPLTRAPKYLQAIADGAVVEGRKGNDDE